MSKKKQQGDEGEPAGKKNRHRDPPYQVHLSPVLRRQLERLCARNETKISHEVRAAIRRHLEANGLWPPTEA